MSEEKEDFLARWSRRKRGGAGEEAPQATPAAEAAGAAESEEEALARLGLPDPDTLVPGDDFAAFMRAAVPAALRRRALRRLWTSNPVLANLDGLNDYDGDFTGGGVAAGGLKTVYEVGRGMLRAGGDSPVGGAAEAPGAEAAAAAEAAPADAEAVLAEAGTEDQETHENDTSKPPRRMRFSFPDQ